VAVEGDRTGRVKEGICSSALSSIEAAHVHHRAPSGVPCAILSLDGVLKVKIKLLETGGIRRLRAAARSAVSDGRYKQARSSRMPGCMLA